MLITHFFFPFLIKHQKKYHNPPKIDASPTPITKLVHTLLPSPPLVPAAVTFHLSPLLPACLQVLPDTPLGGPHPRGGSVGPRIGEQRGKVGTASEPRQILQLG